jgi:hypothetical protein
MVQCPPLVFPGETLTDKFTTGKQNGKHHQSINSMQKYLVTLTPVLDVAQSCLKLRNRRGQPGVIVQKPFSSKLALGQNNLIFLSTFHTHIGHSNTCE